jgi:hypothetical protein
MRVLVVVVHLARDRIALANPALRQPRAHRVFGRVPAVLRLLASLPQFAVDLVPPLLLLERVHEQVHFVRVAVAVVVRMDATAVIFSHDAALN